MTFTQLLPSNSLKAIRILATEQVGEVVGISWRTVGAHGLRSARVYFRYLDAAYTFAKAARRRGLLAFDPTGTYQQLNEAGDPVMHRYEPATYRGFPVHVMLTADAKHPTGWRPAPAFRDQPATQQFGKSERTQEQTSGYRQQREADAPLEDWYDEQLERELNKIDDEITAWWHGRGYTQDSPEAYLAQAEQRKAAARAATRGTLWQEHTRQAVAEGVAKHNAYTIKQKAQREQQQHDLRVNTDDAEIIAALGHWDGETSDDAVFVDELEDEDAF